MAIPETCRDGAACNRSDAAVMDQNGAILDGNRVGGGKDMGMHQRQVGRIGGTSHDNAERGRKKLQSAECCV